MKHRKRTGRRFNHDLWQAEISRKDAVFNVSRVAWLVNALSSGNVDNLRYGSGGGTGMRSLALPPTKQLSADWAKGMVAKTGFTNLSAAVPCTRTSTQ